MSLIEVIASRTGIPEAELRDYVRKVRAHPLRQLKLLAIALIAKDETRQ